MNVVPIRILLVGEVKHACRLRGLLGGEDSTQFHIAHVSDLDLAAKRLSSDPADVLLLELGSKQKQGRTYVQAARAAAPDTPIVILAVSEDEQLAVDAQRQGAQAILVMERQDRHTQ